MTGDGGDVDGGGGEADMTRPEKGDDVDDRGRGGGALNGCAVQHSEKQSQSDQTRRAKY